MGSLHYIAPEALKGETLSVAADLYAVGHLLYLMLIGRAAYHGMAHERVIIHKIYSEGEVDVPRVNGPVNALIMRATRLDPSRRYRSAVQMLGHVRFIQKNFDTPSRAKQTPPGMMRLVNPNMVGVLSHAQRNVYRHKKSGE